MTKLVTFDLWGTLIKSNPEYITQRNALYEEYGIDPELRKKLKVALDETMAYTGVSFSTHAMYSLLLKLSGDNNNDNCSRLYENTKLLVYYYPPLLIFPDTKEALELLKSRGILMRVVSNTSFISGESLRGVLEHYKLKQYFDYCFFSNEHNLCKPSGDAFIFSQEVLRKEFLLDKSCIHIGNDPVTDDTSLAGKAWSHIIINSDSTSLVELVKNIT